MKRKLLYSFLFLAVLLAALPYLLWHVDSGKHLDVLIVDKTVPDMTYREHRGITWALNHYKYLTSEGNTYDLSEDYIGFHPQDDGSYSLTDLESAADAPADLLYIADTYGVYENDFNNSQVNGSRSDLIAGGLTQKDVSEISRRVLELQTPLIAEFNSFASPTESEIRTQFTSLLGISWSGWIGRYFTELDPAETDELPDWLMSRYERHSGNEWAFQDSGLVFVSEEDEVIVLIAGEDFEGEGVTFRFTEKGRDYFNETLVSTYDYWFDVIDAEGAEVLAEYDLGLTDKGVEAMEGYGFDQILPAVTRAGSIETPRYYFAGDYADLEQTPPVYQYRGFDALNRLISRLQFRGPQAFYYRAYLPMVRQILEDTHTNNNEKTDADAEEDIASETNELVLSTRINGKDFEVLTEDGWQILDVVGVNMGMARPGSWPGEAAISLDEYTRWIKQIHDMGANVIRVYTIHPPEFYQALWQHNQNSDTPMFIMHGVWAEEEQLETELDAYTPEIIDTFEAEIRDVVDVIHGQAELPERQGHASGRFTYDISPYVAGYILGVEWYPRMVEQTNDRHEDTPEFEGEYFTTQEANAFEKWLAARMDYTVTYEAQTYQAMRPISFTNWPTTDLLDHPSEPSVEEDLVSVDPNHIYETDVMEAGYFASYHVYPYYPDFLNHDPEYLSFIDHRGEENSYAGYLNDLISAHRMPLVVAEFGIPASRGQTHRNPFGWNQGFMSEKEQGETVVRLFDDLFEQGAAGGLVFTWQDEWFKRTWNTMELDNPDQRPYWSNVQTNEQRFGLLGFETFKHTLNGSDDTWIDTDALLTDESGLVRSLSVDHDEAYMYFRAEVDTDKWTSANSLAILLDTIPGQGNQRIDRFSSASFETGFDFMIELSEMNQSRVWIDHYYDPFYFQYGVERNDLESNDAPERDSGAFTPVHYALSKPMTIPSTGEEIAFDYYETGLLREGIGDPSHVDYDSLSDYYYDEERGVYEVRIPWLLLNFKDPSHKEVMGDLYTNGLESSEWIDGIGLKLLAVNDEEIIQQLPVENESILYTWENWEIPVYTERVKQSYYILQDYLINRR